jgi:2,4-dienoyl-CoA reductase-like NADH-dependent reductase (Old Yellow Enzyme family)/thioredoxin reductase
MTASRRYPRVFSPLMLGPVQVPNRFYFAPHGVALTIGSAPSEDFVLYNTARVAGGGCGLVVTSMTVHDRGRHFQPSPYPQANIPAFRAMADGIHRAGGKFFGELWYWWGMYGQWEPLSPPAPALSASVAQYGIADRTVSTREMSKEDIRGMIGAFAQSTRHLRETGADGVMLHASHGGVLEQFVSPYFNHRTDEYGGSLENRMRFLIEALEATREAGGGALAVGMRFNCDELLPGGYGTRDAREILSRICAAGLVDFVDLDVAVEPNQLRLGMPSVFVEPHVYRPYVEAVRGAAGKVPVMSVLGRLTSMTDGEAAIEAGICDMVGAARALIAEPEFVKNAFQGREERSRICIACNWCLASLGDGAQGCAINPESYRERNWGAGSFRTAAKRSKVIIVGGGPGGLEAARVCALKGHEVRLLEARDHLGGALALWASLPGREFFRHSITWWEREIHRLGAEVRVRTVATAEAILAESPDAVIVASGARYSRRGRSAFLDVDLPGHDRSFVHVPEDILLGSAQPRGKVVLLDGEGLNTSVGVAEVLARAGAAVEYLTPGFTPISARVADSQESLFIMKRWRATGVRISPSTYIRRIGDRQVTAYDVFTEEERLIEADAVVLCTAREPVSALAAALEGKVPQLYTIGDALAARPFAAAAYEGQKFARYVGEPGAPQSVSAAYFRS